MYRKNIYILGAGAMARETYQIYKDLGKGDLVKGFIVNTKVGERSMVWDKKIYEENIIKKINGESLFVVGIGTPDRKHWIERLMRQSCQFDTAVHKSVIVGYQTKINSGTIICAEATLTCDISIGQHVIINNNATINHDCLIEDFVTIGPGVNIGGRVTIGEASFIGIGTIVVQDVKIGKKSFIGAGSVVVKDIPDGVLAFGTPAKPVRRITNKDWKDLI